MNRMRPVCFRILLVFSIIIINSTFFYKTSQSGILEPDASFLGTHDSERVGYALCGGGDVNGDGLSDFMVGSFHNSDYGQDSGTAYLILGSRPFAWTILDSLARADAQFFGGKRFLASGYSVANNGDLNGDGFDDILIGAPGGNSKLHEPGRVYIVNGRATANWGNQAVLSQIADGAVIGEVNWDRLGVSVSFVGDVNGDGLDDFLCGAPDNSQIVSLAGKVYFFLGKSTNWSLTTPAIAEARATFTCDEEDANAGFSVAGVGDVNGDQIPDFLIGAPGISKTYLILGRRETNWGHSFDLAKNADVIFTSESNQRHQNGYSVAGAGDVNGDGLNDMIIGAIHARPNGRYSGKAYLILGRQGGWSNRNFGLSLADASYNGKTGGDFAGWSVASAGDVDGDGFNECLVGMFNEDNKKNVPGEAYFIPGQAEGWLPDQSLGSLPTFVGEENYQLCGFCVSLAGDVDGDHWSDFLIAAPYYSSDSAGVVYLFRSDRAECFINGRVKYAGTDWGIPNFPVQFSGEFVYRDTTNSTGNYETQLYCQADYVVSFPLQDQLALGEDCISAYDAALAARAALNLETLGEYGRIAADVDADQIITSFDAAMILRAGLGLAPYSNSRAGKWGCPDSLRHYENIQSDYHDQNYECLIYGDVDASWQPGGNQRLKNTVDTPARDVVVQPGNEFVLPVNFESNQNILAFDLWIYYDSAVFQFKSAEKTGLTGNFTLSHADTKKGLLKLSAYCAYHENRGGTYALIKFDVSKDFNDRQEIRIEKMKMNDQSLPPVKIVVKTDKTPLKILSFCVLQNYPNPFNAFTRIAYELPKKLQVNACIFNDVGQKICSIVNIQQESGSHSIEWDGCDTLGNAVPSGIYFLRISAGNYQQIRKLVLIR